jgi:hypothetical protein
MRRMRDARRNSQRERGMTRAGEMEGYTPIDRAKAEELLATTTQLPAAFWEALSELEGALDGIEISGTRDLSETTIDELIEEEAGEDNN